MIRFQPGETAVWRSVWRADRVIGTAWPWTVVIDSDELIALFRPVGTPGKQRSGERGGPRGRMLVRWDGGYEDLTWTGVHVLAIHRMGDMYSVWRAWDPSTWELKWRYLNLEERWTRTAIGFDSKDLYLDLWADPSGSEWHWKDDDEARWAVEHGLITEAQLAAARTEGGRAVRAITRRESPHDRDWDAWRPDPTWSTPTLPADWKEYEPGPPGARDEYPRD